MDVDQLFQAIDWRVQQLKVSKEKQKPEGTAPPASEPETTPTAPPVGEKRSQTESSEDTEQPAKKAR